MAAILRSSVIQTARRAFSGEGTLSVRALHAGRTGRKVGPLFKKIDDVAIKKSVAGYTTSHRMKTNDLGAKPWLIASFLTLAFLQGCSWGYDDAKSMQKE